MKKFLAVVRAPATVANAAQLLFPLGTAVLAWVVVDDGARGFAAGLIAGVLVTLVASAAWRGVRRWRVNARRGRRIVKAEMVLDMSEPGNPRRYKEKARFTFVATQTYPGHRVRRDELERSRPGRSAPGL